MMNCPNCNARISKNSERCVYCKSKPPLAPAPGSVGLDQFEVAVKNAKQQVEVWAQMAIEHRRSCQYGQADHFEYLSKLVGWLAWYAETARKNTDELRAENSRLVRIGRRMAEMLNTPPEEPPERWPCKDQIDEVLDDWKCATTQKPKLILSE